MCLRAVSNVDSQFYDHNLLPSDPIPSLAITDKCLTLSQTANNWNSHGNDCKTWTNAQRNLLWSTPTGSSLALTSSSFSFRAARRYAGDDVPPLIAVASAPSFFFLFRLLFFFALLLSASMFTVSTMKHMYFHCARLLFTIFTIHVYCVNNETHTFTIHVNCRDYGRYSSPFTQATAGKLQEIVLCEEVAWPYNGWLPYFG